MRKTKHIITRRILIFFVMILCFVSSLIASSMGDSTLINNENKVVINVGSNCVELRKDSTLLQLFDEEGLKSDYPVKDNIRPGPTTATKPVVLKPVNGYQPMSNKQVNRVIHKLEPLDELENLKFLEDLSQLRNMNTNLMKVQVLLSQGNVDSNYLLKESQMRLEKEAAAYPLYPLFVLISVVGFMFSVKHDYRLWKIFFLLSCLIFMFSSIYFLDDYLTYRDILKIYAG